MIIGGVSADTLLACATAWDCTLYNFRPVGKRFGFVLKTSRKDFMRRSPRNKRRVGPCFHIYREFIRLAFECGADYLQTTGARSWQSGGSNKQTYHSWPEFRRDLEEFGEAEMSNRRASEYLRMVDLCEHGDCDGERFVA